GVGGYFTTHRVGAGGGGGLYLFLFPGGAPPPGPPRAKKGQPRAPPPAGGAFHSTITATILSSLCNGSRSYTLTIGSPGCQFSVAPANHAFSSQGGVGVVSVNAAAGCAWTAVSNDPLITITSGANGAGNGRVGFARSQHPNPRA